MAEDPQAAGERRRAARHLLQQPFTCAEHDPDVFALIRRHEDQLDRWFTQRFGYRLQVSTDTARLAKSGSLADARPLRTASGRPFHRLEHVLLALTLASTVAGPSVISLRDLVDLVRAAAADAGVNLQDDGTTRRAQVAVLRWMVDHGLAVELHDQVDAYKDDAEADAVLRMRPDRIALLPLPAMVDAADADDLRDRAGRRPARRTWLRIRLVEGPVLYRHDLDDDEWDELRRRQAEDARLIEEMFGLLVEARAEGVAAIDPAGNLSDLRFPGSGTVHHAALLITGELARRGHWRPSSGDDMVPVGGEGWIDWGDLVTLARDVTQLHRKRWRADLVGDPERLVAAVIELLVGLRLAEVRQAASPAARLLPAAARFRAVIERRAGDVEQPALL